MTYCEIDSLKIKGEREIEVFETVLVNLCSKARLIKHEACRTVDERIPKISY